MPGFTENLLEDSQEAIQSITFDSQINASHQVAKIVANHAIQSNGKQNMYCADTGRLKFIFYNGDKWLEDMNKEKTLRDVCKCILEKLGDPSETISDLGILKKEELLSEDHYGYAGPNDMMLTKHVLDYQQDIAKTIRQIQQCADDTSDDGNNDFAKDYLKKLAKLVRGDAEDRNKARKLVK
jgi:hypothetical protein